jgi:hypothetical protein
VSARGKIPSVGAGRCRSHVSGRGTAQHVDSAEDRKSVFRWDRWAVVAVGSGLQYFQAALFRFGSRDPSCNCDWQSFFRDAESPQAEVMRTGPFGDCTDRLRPATLARCRLRQSAKRSLGTYERQKSHVRARETFGRPDGGVWRPTPNRGRRADMTFLTLSSPDGYRSDESMPYRSSR